MLWRLPGIKVSRPGNRAALCRLRQPFRYRGYRAQLWGLPFAPPAKLPLLPLANPRELFSGEHINNPGSTNPGFHGYELGMFGNHLADDGGFRAERMAPHGS
jgi:hypothetical protein